MSKMALSPPKLKESRKKNRRTLCVRFGLDDIDIEFA